MIIMLCWNIERHDMVVALKRAIVNMKRTNVTQKRNSVVLKRSAVAKKWPNQLHLYSVIQHKLAFINSIALTYMLHVSAYSFQKE